MSKPETESRDDSARPADLLGRALGLPDGQRPFPWQLELLRRLLRGDLVEALDIPTGLGKTAVMAIWLVALAGGAKVPRRLVYVVDRRAVVDQATDVAERLRKWAGEEPAVVAALQLQNRSLPISTLRGQHVDNREWLEDPSSAAIVIGTVDMIGSRLLFSGYGVSSKMRPYHAGLLGNDALIVLDEAHLSQPFERLIEQLARGVDANGRELRPIGPLDALLPRFRSLSLSATGRDRPLERVLRLTEEDRVAGSVVDKRLRGKKRLAILPDVSDKELPEALAEQAWKLSDEGKTPARTIIFCTSREHAQKVQEALKKRAKNVDTAEPVLFVGGRRVWERELAATRLRDLGFIAGSKVEAKLATFVIATAAGEVGVDLDADHCVCDLVAWERMVQRLGRVNRRGDGDARITVVPTKATNEAEQARREAVRELLKILPGDEWVDVSLAALTALKERSRNDESLRATIEKATTPAPLHPPLTRALVESWSMTSLESHTGRPEVAPWIRGWPDEEEEPQTTLVWRRHLPLVDEERLLGRRDLKVFRDAADPHLAETLETETWRAVAWLEKRMKILGAHDFESTTGERKLRRSDVVAVIFDPAEGEDGIVRGEDVSTPDARERLKRRLAGATLMLDRRIGGLLNGLLAEDSDQAVDDVTEQESPRVVPFQVRRLTDKERDEELSNDGDEDKREWRTEATVLVRPSEKEEGSEAGWLVIESVITASAESEEGRSGARQAQLLVDHQDWAEQEARAIAARLSLPTDLAELLAVAAKLHDEGKRASRWQRAFHAPEGGDPIAKSATKRPNLKLLEHYRHEFGSLPYAEAHARVKALDPDARDVCLHLIAAHHGYARPVIRTDGAEDPPMCLALRAREVALRFASLEKRWGPWGLAWWEALLRAADQRASRRNDEEAKNG